MVDKIALLFSGGLDSFCLHRHYTACGIDHDLLWINCGTETNRYEQKRIRIMEDICTATVHEIKGLDLTEMETSSGFVPLRNLLFAAIPVMHGYNQVAIAAVKGEGSLDKSRKFFRDTSDLFSYMLEKPIRIVAPVDTLTKTELVHRTLKHNYAMEHEIRLTTSCYRPERKVTSRCGTCQACVRRWVAMTLNNIYESYDVDPYILASKIVSETPRTALFQQPLGRWPDVILTNKELREAVEHVKKVRML